MMGHDALKDAYLKHAIPVDSIRASLVQATQLSGAEKSLVAVVFLQRCVLQNKLSEIYRLSLILASPAPFVHAYEQQEQTLNPAEAKNLEAENEQLQAAHAQKIAEHEEKLHLLANVYAPLEQSVLSFEQLRATYWSELVEQLEKYFAPSLPLTEPVATLKKRILRGDYDKLISGSGVLKTRHHNMLKQTIASLSADWSARMSSAAIRLRDELLEGNAIVDYITPFLPRLEKSALTPIEQRRLIFFVLILLSLNPSGLEDREMAFTSIVDDVAHVYADDPELIDKLKEALELLRTTLLTFEGQVMPYLKQLAASSSHVTRRSQGIQQVADRLQSEIETRKVILQEVIEMLLSTQQSQTPTNRPSPS